jgi:ADP-ribose pyrophosphatase
MSRQAPTGNDAEEWKQWLFENAGTGADHLATQIAAAMGRNASKPEHAFCGVGQRPQPAPASSWPRITNRSLMRVSPWVELIAREVEFAPGAEPQVYHSVRGPDYVVVLAVTPEGLIPLVRQYRPAEEDFTLEFPAGIIDGGEGAADTARRELLEESGFPARKVYGLGVNKTDAGRLSNRMHSYSIQTEVRVSDFQPEAGIATRLVTLTELVELILSGELDAQTNLGTLLQAVLRGHLQLPG